MKSNNNRTIRVEHMGMVYSVKLRLFEHFLSMELGEEYNKRKPDYELLAYTLPEHYFKELPSLKPQSIDDPSVKRFRSVREIKLTDMTIGEAKTVLHEVQIELGLRPSIDR